MKHKLIDIVHAGAVAHVRGIDLFNYHRKPMQLVEVFADDGTHIQFRWEPNEFIPTRPPC